MDRDNRPNDRPRLALTRPELFRPDILHRLQRHLDLVPFSRLEPTRCEAIWIDPEDQTPQRKHLPNVRYLVSNTTDTRHLSRLRDELIDARQRAKLISLQGLDLSRVTSTADFTQILCQLALRPTSRDEPPGRMIEGANVVILGEHGGNVGRVAGQLADRLRMLGANVAICHPARLYRLGPSADLLVVCMPAFGQYDGLLNQVTLSALRPGCVVVNTARDRLVDDHAMVAALRSGQVRRYAVDFPLTPHADVEDRIIQFGHVAGYEERGLRQTQLLTLDRLEDELERDGLICRAFTLATE